MNIIDKLLNRLTMYVTLLWVLRVLIAGATVLAFFGVIDYTWWHIVFDMVLFLVFCWGSNWILSKLFGVKPNYESQYITGEILTLIVGPLNPLTGWWIILVISALAMAGKYFIVYNRRHIFNPAASAVLVSALLIHQGASWWIGGRYMLPLVVLGGLFVARKLKWMHLVFSFLIAYILMLTITLYHAGLETSVIVDALKTTILDSGTFFFATIMLVEPMTAPRTKLLRILYGVLVAVLMVMLPIWFPSYGYSIETALLIGNLAAFLITSKEGRQYLKFAEKKLEAKDTYSLWFEPEKHLSFKPGQFLEWMLDHPKPDSRGLRRFFTISSSPEQERMRIVVKFAAASSTFKKALLNMSPGDKLSVSSLQGEFTLPEEGRKLAFIAGGVGLTPFLSMLQYMMDKKQSRDTVLFYANKTADEIAYQPFFKDAASVGLKMVYLVTENPPAGWTGHTGFLTPEIIKAETPDWQERLFYISGPEPMVVAYKKMLSQMGIPGSHIKRDYFPGYQA